MKKIVALVLCLVLALSLCTVAFADTKGGDETSKTLDLEDYALLDMSDKNADVTPEADELKLHTKTPYIDTAADTTTYYADIYTFDDAAYYAVSADAATHKLVKGSKTIAYLVAGTDADWEVKTDIEVKTFTEGKADADCGEFFVDTYATASGFVYSADADTAEDWAYFKGEFVLLVDAEDSLITDEDVDGVYNAHDFTDKDYVYDKGHATSDIVGIYCDDCDKKFTILTNLKSYNNEDLIELTEGDDTLYVVLGTAKTAAADKDGTTVESAKTFDAGIALYAGMALASVAGSAVVIGKKKEF